MHLVQDDTEIELGLRECRPQRDRLAIRRCRLVKRALHLKKHTNVVVCFGVITSGLDGGPIGRHCLIEIALLLEGVAERQKGFGIVRFKSKGLPMRYNGIRQPDLLLQHRSEIIITRRMIRPQLNLATNEPLGAREIALLSRNDCKITVGSRVVGINT